MGRWSLALGGRFLQGRGLSQISPRIGKLTVILIMDS
ncbi:hypothetical protein CJA_1990 [Cellvibrio japonicus Ueda107]|uniref:Uncharacterized protein n=1 Tax=Cellvibrio japonicus (strain Ueda107) TaxID=498211 RepID=B3PHJ0_CELJU|nr:hypothetical protein CJA_1990 [Cellvibrio japonicus Ueda107]